MRGFESPEITTAEDRGEVGLAHAFTLRLEYDRDVEFDTPRGGRIHRRISGGEITGRLNGSVYPNGGGVFSQRRSDNVVDFTGHVLLRPDNGEWVYLTIRGYERPDGYFRVAAWMDADERGDHTWTHQAMLLGTGGAHGNGGTEITFYETV